MTELEQQARKEAEDAIRADLDKSGAYVDWHQRKALERAYAAALISERSKPSLFDRMEAVCRRRYRDGDTVYFRTLGMSDENTGQFLVRINRMFLHRASSLKDAIEAAVKEFEESDDPNDQLEPLPPVTKSTK